MAESMSRPNLFPPSCDHHPNHKGVANAAQLAITLYICLTLVVARFYCRKRILKALWWDDYTVMCSLVSRKARPFWCHQAHSMNN